MKTNYILFTNVFNDYQSQSYTNLIYFFLFTQIEKGEENKSKMRCVMIFTWNFNNVNCRMFSPKTKKKIVCSMPFF